MFILGYADAQEIFRNAHSAIYRATALASGQPVLLKIALASSDESTAQNPTHQQRKRFQLEYEILQKLQGVGAPQPLTCLEQENHLALVCADFQGVSLEQESAALDLGDFFCIAQQLTEVLGSLHQNDILHLNLHLATIFFEPHSKQIKIVDFGYAAQFSREHQPVVSPQILHSNLAYISPEQTGRMNRSIDYRSDFYSLGVIFYRLLTGQLPFTAQDAMGMVHCHIAQEPPPPQRAEIPTALVQVVLKLLAKTAEQRYQSAFGIKADLQACERLWRTGTDLANFVPGSADISSRFLIPQKLYGRENAIERLQKAFDRHSCAPFCPKMIVVQGPAGIGKSTLVNEMHKLAAKGPQHGYFASGRCDQYRSNQPFYALIEACQQLTRQLLTENEERIAYWRDEMRSALGDHGQIIVELIPEAQWLIGEQTPLPLLSPNETQNRFSAVLQSFIAMFARPEHPFTLFIDDLQWVDHASLRLLQTLLLDQSNSPLLIIGAYRNNEVANDSALAKMLASVQRGDTHLGTHLESHLEYIALHSLDEGHIQNLIMDTLTCSREASQPLAKQVYSKTHGIPFFVNQLLYDLFAEHLIEFDANQGRWVWDIAAIQQSPIRDNVIDAMVKNIHQLDPATQRLLQYAATIGHCFDLVTLSQVAELTLEATISKIRLAQQEGILQRSLNQHTGESAKSDAPKRYEFQHPRLQQAAYSLLSDEQAAHIHWQVGRSLLRNLSATARNERIVEIVNHLNLGRHGMHEASELQELAEFNLQAGLRALDSFSYVSAAAYSEAGLACLPEDGWQSQYALSFALQLLHAIALFHSGHQSDAYCAFERAIEQAQNTYDKACACEQYSIALQNSGATSAALQLALQALASVEVQLPSDTTHFSTQLLNTLSQATTLSRLADLPRAKHVTQNEKLLARLFERCALCMYFAAPKQLSLIVQHSLEAPRAVTSYEGIALAWCAMLLRQSGQLPQAFAYAELALLLDQECDDRNFQGKTQILVHSHSLSLKHPFAQNENALAQAQQICHSAGDMQYASFGHFGAYLACLTQGANFTRILDLCQQWHDYCEKYAPLELGQAQIRLAAHRHLMGIALPELDVDAILANYGSEHNHTEVMQALIEMAHCAAIFGEYDEAWQYCSRATDLLTAGAAASALLNLRLRHISVLCCAKLWQSQLEHQAHMLALAQSALAELKRLAEISPNNFLSYYQHAHAQWLRAQGDEEQAAHCYLQAIKHARKHGYVLLQAWANEMLAEMYAADGWQVAPAFRAEAQRLYRECAAFGKADSMQLHSADTPLATAAPSVVSVTPAPHESTPLVSEHVLQTATPATTADGPRAQRAIGPQLLDLSAIVKSSQAISSEIELEKLIGRMMRIIVENAGAQDGMLLLYQGESLVLHALVERRIVKLMHGNEPASGINWAVINYVVRTCAPVVLDNAAHDGPFVRDDWVLQSQPRSVLCVPLLNQGRITGIIYLENNLVTGAFTPDRIAVLELMASQAAIALKNASLYSDLQREQTVIRELNESLERRVIERSFEAESARKRLTDLTEALPLSVFQTRAEEGKLVYIFVSENVRDMLGVSAEEIKANPEARWRNVLPQDHEKCMLLVQQAVTDLSACDFSQRVEFDGRVRWIHAYTVAPEWISGAWVWNGFWIDETRTRLQEDELREAKNLAEAATRTKSMFLANMSHEIRTPMNAIIGLSHLALMTQLNERQHDYLAKIHNAGTALLGIINDILDFSKIEAGQLSVENTDFMLEQVLDNLTAMLGQKITSKGLRLVFDLAPDIPTCLCGDSLRLGQVFINLLSNAVKFTERGEIRLTGKVLEAVGARVKLKFAIHDQGIGIAPEQAQRLFQAFTQADDSTSRKYGGTGLGLSICKSLVELMGGNIWVESTPAIGSTFYFTAWFGLGAGQIEKTITNSRNMRFDGMSVLLVEDNPINQQIAIELMQLAGIAVDVAEHGGHALEMLKADKHYDVVLMDLQMPVVDGYSATKAIRSDPSKANLPIIAMTAYAMSEERQRCLDAGMNDHISKPIDPDMLFDALARWHSKPESTTNSSSSTRQGFKVLHNSANTVNRTLPKAIDSVAALRRVGGNQGLYHKLLSRFASKSASTVAEIKHALAQHQKQEAERMAHTVRGVAGNLGAMPLADAACDLELAINANAGNAADYLQVFESRMAEFVEQAQLLLAEPLE